MSETLDATVPSPDPAPAPAPAPPAPPAPTNEPTAPPAPTNEPTVPPAPTNEPTAPPVQTPVVEPVVVALTKELSDVVDGIAHDLSGSVVTVGDLLRFVPRLASLVHTIQIRGSEKRDMVIAAAHVLVDRVIGAGDRPAAHALVDVVFPHAIASVIDVVAGRVTFQQAAATAAVATVAAAAANPVVVAQVGNCLTQLLACLAKK
jgi:hypothetical protein